MNMKKLRHEATDLVNIAYVYRKKNYFLFGI